MGAGAHAAKRLSVYPINPTASQVSLKTYPLLNNFRTLYPIHINYYLAGISNFSGSPGKFPYRKLIAGIPNRAG